MFLVFLVISHLTLISVANPFHKYPYVFLLDIGNEELEKTNTEQIRLSIPGGSLAIRFPAVGNGDTIGHIRVTGVDFGTDLKSSIVEGGPGYKYVVLVFVGNPGVPYDAVVTVQTVADDNSYSVQNIEAQDMNTDRNYYQVEENLRAVSEDENNSAENLNDDVKTSETQYSEKTNSKTLQMSSDAYSYVQNEVNNNDYNDDSDDNVKDIHKQYIENPNLYKQMNTEQETRVKDNIEDSNYQAKENYNQNNEDDESDQEQQNDEDYEQSDESDQNDEQKNPEAEKYTSQDSDLNGKKEAIRYVDRNLYNKYKVLQPHLFSGVKIYPQEEEVQSEPVHDEIDQMFNDEEIHNDGEEYTDSNNNNNNYFDSDDSSAVES